ncbi:MAG TPA: right-handed parallel beta-helix repeat-containing protein, partial [Kiritimatiellia bacterium]|nr:right-handed parallel beta-helix repeat-containing protein [Kiritimatiellia bacterium]
MPSMKTLQQVEPRTPIEALPYDIVQPGSYYVTGPLFSTNHGIRIFANDVTLDLMGNTITGGSSTNFHGIHVVANDVIPYRNIVIRNGGVSEFGNGVYLQNVAGGSVRDMTVSQNAGIGIWIQRTAFTSRSIMVENNTVTDNGGTGIFISGQTAAFNQSHVIRNNAVSGNGVFGISVAFANGVLIDGNVVGPQVNNGTTYGISSTASRSYVLRNMEYGNTNGYIFVDTSSTRGPVVNVSGTLASTGTANHAWANFSQPVP